MQLPPPDPATVTAAIRALATLESLDQNPSSRPPGFTEPTDRPWMLLHDAVPAMLDELEAAIPGATGTGRIALAQVIQGVDRERGARVIARLLDDRTAAHVDTCLVGFRSVAQWARTMQPGQTYHALQASRLRWLAWIAVAAALALLWLYGAR